MAMTTAVETRPGTNPDRASFTSALQTARDQLTAAAGVCPHPDEPVDLLGAIGRAVLTTLLPARRARYSARKVKCATSRYLHRDDGRPAASTPVTGIAIHLHTPPPLHPARSVRSRRTLRPCGPRPPTRRDRVTALLASDPHRAWSGAELAENLQIPKHNMLTQLAEWARLGFFTRAHAGSYTLNPPAAADHSCADSRDSGQPGRWEERGKVERPQRSEDERPCAETSGVHNRGGPGSDTPTPATCQTRPLIT